MAAAHCFSRPDEEPADPKRPQSKLSSIGATEEQVNLRAMIPQRNDRQGTKVEDLAGRGEFEGEGG
jgi:hypothetical protein